MDNSKNTISDLQQKCGLTPDGKWGPNTFKAARDHFKLSGLRAAHFFGQCNHETGNFSAFVENLNYSDIGLVTTFKKYFPTIESTVGYARNPEKIANHVYANRMGNGDEASGDGFKFRGRGAIQLTGRINYQAFADHVGRPDVMTNPDIVSTELAFESALYFFDKNNLWSICDAGVDDKTITQVTKHVNGGTLGLDDRTAKTRMFYSWN
jgi:putative chitinase